MIGAIVGAVVASGLIEEAGLGVVEGISSYFTGKMEANEQKKKLDMNEQLIMARPNDYIQMRVTHDEMIGGNYNDVIRNLAGIGFYDINIHAIYERKGMFSKERRGVVRTISINGNSSFDEMSVFPRDSHVVVNAVVHEQGDYLLMPELDNIRRGAVMFQRPVMRCQYCGITVSQGQRFCIGCGAPV